MFADFADLDFADYTAAIVTLDRNNNNNAATTEKPMRNNDDDDDELRAMMWFDQLTAAAASASASASASSWRSSSPSPQPQHQQRHHRCRLVRDRKSSLFENGAPLTCVYGGGGV